MGTQNIPDLLISNKDTWSSGKHASRRISVKFSYIAQPRTPAVCYESQSDDN